MFVAIKWLFPDKQLSQDFPVPELYAMAHCCSLSHWQLGKLMFCGEIKFWFPALQTHQLNLRLFSVTE